MNEASDPRSNKPERSNGRAPSQPAAARSNKRLQLQTRKVLGKHYASKYRTGRK